MVSCVKELSPAKGMMDEADGMPMVRMRVPVQAPTPADVAVVRPPVDPDAGENRHQDSCIENAGVEPVPRAAGVQPFPRKETGEQGHQATRSITCAVVPDVLGSKQSNSAGGKGPKLVTTPPTIPRAPAASFGGMRDRLRIPRNSPAH